MAEATSPELDPRFLAAIDMIRRTGAKTIQVRFSDDEPPVVWIVTARHQVAGGVPVAKGGKTVWSAAGGMTPWAAAISLLDDLVDGGTCVHCGRPAGVTADNFSADMPMGDVICWTAYDPEMDTFRRACEGTT